MSDLKPLSAEELDQLDEMGRQALTTIQPERCWSTWFPRLVAQARRALELDDKNTELDHLQAAQAMELEQLHSKNAALKAQVGFLKTQLNIFENSDAMAEIIRLSAAFGAAVEALEHLNCKSIEGKIPRSHTEDCVRCAAIAAIRKHRGEK